ncbi:MAG: PKD domain-containing protein [Saprospiraceae bacterium]
MVTPPTAGFGAGSTVGCEPFMVTFNNQSSANAATYQWSFPGGNPTTSTDVNPVVEYAAAGTYTVELIASNAQFSSDTVTFTNYITVNPIPTTNFTSMVDLANDDLPTLVQMQILMFGTLGMEIQALIQIQAIPMEWMVCTL